ncbi:hypothetical protein F511_33706 [Dorcoceras hygrometricum]|uniref:Uncharacterized protein n=1 Tax=Dorcoceras hygrometricum TaxID=472368 RepID=A0A2Z7CUL9_9LAMI|nr:hypothetical protein F511_33706 [Dorcoceras hygrometricum]
MIGVSLDPFADSLGVTRRRDWSTRSVLGKCVYLVTLAMSLFDLQDVCIAIISTATLDLPMVVDLIGIYGLKGPYCTLNTTNWFLQALSVIPRGSWGDVARRSYHDPLGSRLAPSPPRVAGIRSGQFDEENPSVQISSRLLVQGDEGVSYPVVDRIGDIYRNLPRRADVIVTTVGARHKCQQDRKIKLLERSPGRRRVRRCPITHAHEARDLRAGRASQPLSSARHRATVAHEAAESGRPSSSAQRALVAQLPCAGRTIEARRTAAGREVLREVGAPLRTTLVGTMMRRRLEAWRHGLVAGRPMCADDGARSHMKRRSCSGRARALAPHEFFVVAPAAGRPPLRRVSGDVMTAGLFLLGFGSDLSRAAREVFGPVHDVGPGFGRF